VPGYEIGTAGDNLDAVAEIYAAVGFRPDLVDDLYFLRRLGGEIFVAAWGGTVAGASSCIAFAGTGWIGGVAVLAEHGRRGLGTELTDVALRALKSRGVTTALLHATEMARPLYERMGFVPEGEFAELHGRAAPPPASPGAPPLLRPGTGTDLAAVLNLDHRATGEDRGRLLRPLWPQGSLVHDEDGTVRGFLLRQTGSAVGAVIAEPDAGLDLLATALSTGTAATGGDLRVPVPVAQTGPRELLRRLGFREAFRTTRMHLGPSPAWHADRIFSAFNLYWG
jgi:GNAT superfamily N-acetyltransferase